MGILFQKSQKVITPDGEGLVEEVIGEEVSVKLTTGDTKTYSADDVEDDSDSG